MTPLTTQLEAFLFVEGGPVPRKKLIRLLGCSEKELEVAILELDAALSSRGITLIKTETEISLAVAPSAQPSLDKAFEKELGSEVGDAGLEVLSIILYRGASTRAQIDYVRGVNSSSTIRTLLSRGLVERAGNPEDAREYLYRPTVELLAHLGVRTAQELPEYATIAGELAAFEKSQQASEPFDHGSQTPEPSND